MITTAQAGFNVGPGTGRNNNMGYVNGDYYDIGQTINNTNECLYFIFPN